MEFKQFIKTNCPFYEFKNEIHMCKRFNNVKCIVMHICNTEFELIQSMEDKTPGLCCRILYWKWSVFCFELMWENEMNNGLKLSTNLEKTLTHIYPDKRNIWGTDFILSHVMRD